MSFGSGGFVNVNFTEEVRNVTFPIDGIVGLEEITDLSKQISERKKKVTAREIGMYIVNDFVV